MYLIFDTETTGLPKRWNAPLTDQDNWPRCVQIAWQLHDEAGKLLEQKDYLVQATDFTIPFEAEQIHGISTDLANEKGVSLAEVLDKFQEAISRASFMVGQNVGFDINIMGAEFLRLGRENPLEKFPILDTCTERSASLCRLPGGRGGKFKLPTLTELHEFLFKEPFVEAHNATADVEATSRCFLELVRTKHFTEKELRTQPGYLERFVKANPTAIAPEGINHINLAEASREIRERLEEASDSVGISSEEENENLEKLDEIPFSHLHNHSQFSILQSTISIKTLVDAAGENNMPAVALTDHANMMGAFRFVKEVENYNKQVKAKNAEASQDTTPAKELKAIVGCELFVCEDHKDRTRKDNGFQIVFLAKNKTGYNNLAKMSSLAYTDGFYYVPRIDREIVKKYKEGLVVLTGNLYGEVPGKILNVGEKQAEDALLWWKQEFGEDLYVELMRHGQEDEDRVNPVLLELAKKHRVKIVATNNTYYCYEQDANAHDILLCIKDGEKQATPIGRGRGYRYGLPNKEYYFKSGEEMKFLFKDLPEAISNTVEITEKIEPYELARDVLLPAFGIPDQFLDEKDKEDQGKRGENAYLKHLTYKGAEERYAELSPEIKERLDFELSVIANTGYPGYFLIVQDLIAAARKMDVSVGPGRGSAAGSVVAYCLKITNIDPLKYDLLFERFLNPDRVSMPDIDIDFDDEGRSRVMDYVIEKYGANQVAQIITYGTMAAKSSIRDTARVLDLPLHDADRLAKLIPNMAKLKTIFGADEKKLHQKFRQEELQKINELITISKGEDPEAQTVNQAQVLEGSLRNTGIHACGVIITPGDITNYVPVAVAKDSDLYVTQFDNSVVESAGLLKMDFLGLKTLSLIKDTVEIVKGRHGITLDPDSFPLDDEKTYQLFQRGETVGIFQYESPGMQKYMKELKPTVFDDLIAMNALYRPGPIEYIPSFILRKQGEEEISYDLPVMEEYLQETYGITVYQEQVMLLSQKLAGFTKGEADVLRKAMGKKIFALLEELKPKFLDGGEANGHPRGILEKIWKDWEAFAAYAFNKSHSTCYAWIAYQTAYLKAHYPAEYMAAVLSNNMNDIKQVTFFMEECKRMKLQVLGPDVNESYYKFSVNKENAIRFGMGAIKGVGNGAVATIVDNRKEKGFYKSIFDLAKRIDLRAANKRAFESLALAGGFDNFGDTHRAQYFKREGDGITFLEKVVKYGAKAQENENSSQVSLFGETSDVQIPEPEVPPCEEWGTLEKLKREREVVGIFISGHPLDDYKIEMQHFCGAQISDFQSLDKLVNREMVFGGIVGEVQHRTTKKGTGWAIFTIEDFSDSYEFKIFNKEYVDFRNWLVPNTFVYVKVFVKPGWENKETGQKGGPKLQFRSIELLSEILPKYAKKLTIQMRINDLQEEKINELHNLFHKYPGKGVLNFVIYEQKEKLKVHMPSRKTKIEISPELLNHLDEEQVYYRLN